MLTNFNWNIFCHIFWILPPILKDKSAPKNFAQKVQNSENSENFFTCLFFSIYLGKEKYSLIFFFVFYYFQKRNCWTRRREFPSFKGYSQHHFSWWKWHHPSASDFFQIFSTTDLVRFVQKSHTRNRCWFLAFITDNVESITQPFHEISNGLNWQLTRADLV